MYRAELVMEARVSRDLNGLMTSQFSRLDSTNKLIDSGVHGTCVTCPLPFFRVHLVKEMVFLSLLLTVNLEQ